jgi:C-terminal processing protease CtpA/Prc
MKLADVWCAVRYFHPWISYRAEIDWDGALIAAISNVLTADDEGAFASALGSMLEVICDPVTRVRAAGRDSERTSMKENSDFATPLHSNDLLLSFRAHGDDFYAGMEALKALLPNLASIDRIIFDLRHSENAELCMEVTGFERRLSTRRLIGPGRRSRRHRGHVAQSGANYGEYESSLVTSDGKVIDPDPEAKDFTCVFIVDAKSGVPSVAIALQQIGMAAIVACGGPEVVEPKSAVSEIKLTQRFTAVIRTSETIHSDGTVGVIPEVTLPLSAVENDPIDAARRWLAHSEPALRSSTPAPAVAGCPRDRDYPEMEYPSFGYRLLAAFRIWGTFNYFFPYKQLIGESWAGVLREFIPRFEAAADATEYAKAVAEMVVRTRDTHSYIGSKRIRALRGEAPVPVHLKIIDGAPVVMRAYHPPDDARNGVEAGDVIRTIDGADFRARMDLVARYVAVSTPQSLRMRQAQFMLLGSEGSTAVIVVERNGREHEVRLKRSEKHWGHLRHQREGDVWRLLGKNIGYADLDRLRISQVDQMFEDFKHTNAIVFDMRGYPFGTAWPIAARLATQDGIVAARFECPVVTVDMLADARRHGAPSWETNLQMIPATDKSRYLGRTLLLIDETAGSQAEHTALFLKTANGTTIVGSPSTGANGDVTNLIVPGDIVINFSGQAVKHADGRQLQRIGVIPDVHVQPTIAGLRAGRDEVLDCALSLCPVGETMRPG